MRPRGVTGVQTHFQQFMGYLQSRAIETCLVTPYSVSKLLVYPLFALRRLIHFFSTSWSVWWYREVHAWVLKIALRRSLRDAEGCVVYAQCPLSAAAALRVRRPGQRVVLVAHFNISQADEWVGMGLIDKDGWLYRSILAFEARVLPQLDGIVYVSRFMQEHVESRIPSVKAVRSVVLPNFVSDPRDVSVASPVADLITIGTVEPRKNQLYLVEILAAAKSMGRVLTLTVVGDGPDLSRMKQRAKHLDVESQIFFKGFVPNAASLISGHRAYIHVARMESFGIVLIEAQACGVPVFAPKAGGMGEAFEDGVTGWGIPLGDVQAAARVLIAIFSDEDMLQSAGSAARERFLNYFETTRVASELRSFLVS
ncbi:glycosyltransferase family 4 protein [Uliginosibacterium paludis]|uniref:Glycosyltransferase family 4 protein n=1 Tax=Uliginosibacterium paludis TaxID=1615952 RepID=A0ABV2CUY1_9RHOO